MRIRAPRELTEPAMRTTGKGVMKATAPLAGGAAPAEENPEPPGAGATGAGGWAAWGRMVLVLVVVMVTVLAGRVVVTRTVVVDGAAGLGGSVLVLSVVVPDWAIPATGPTASKAPVTPAIRNATGDGPPRPLAERRERPLMAGTKRTAA